MSTHIWLRSETKPAEKRTALTPKHAGRLIDAGFRLTVEKSAQSAFDWREYESSGCDFVDEYAWIKSAPEDAIILGLKELETNAFQLRHRHVHFAHVYKEQSGWRDVLSRFQRGGGTLFDLEFLVDENGKRVAAFGHWAGFSGAALAILAWCNHALSHLPVLPPVTPRPSQETLVDEVRSAISRAGSVPNVLLIGALGRCGQGAIELLEAAGANVVAWDLKETKNGGPFSKILEFDIFLNCVFVEKSIPPFITEHMIGQVSRELNVICDVSCDPYGAYNPVPVYKKCTTFDRPVETIIDSDNPLYLIAIDHLPSLLPRESSEDFCEQLLPYLLELNELDKGVWKRASDLFHSKTTTI